MPRTTEVISYACGDKTPFREAEEYVLSRKEEGYIATASEQASLSTEQKRHGAVFVVKGKIVSKGYNREAAQRSKIRHSPLSRHGTTHAESAAIIQFIRRMAHDHTYCSYSRMGGTLYIARVSCGTYRMSRPCDKCTPFLESIPFVKEVVYSDENNKFYKLKK